MSAGLFTLFEPLSHQWPLYLGLLLLLLLVKALASARFKGWLGERGVRAALARLDSGVYHSFHDLYLPRPDGRGVTQVDHVIVSPFGIFVIETKNYRGWIFGKEHEPQWTQQNYRSKKRFQNPLHQNKLHIRALIVLLGLPEDLFISGIFFFGDAEFKTPMPGNVLDRGFLAWIKQHDQPLLQPGEVSRITAVLQHLERATHRPTAAKAHRARLAERGR